MPPPRRGSTSGSWVSTASGLNVRMLADEVLAERQVVRQRSVGLVEERDALVADDPCRRFLLRLTRQGQRKRVEIRVFAALVAAGAADQPADGSRVDPRGCGRGRPEIGVVRVRGDHHEPSGAPRRRRGTRSDWFCHRSSQRSGRSSCLGPCCLERREDGRSMPVGLHPRPDVGDPALRVDQEARPHDAHVLLAVVVLEGPGAVDRRRPRDPRRREA